MHSSYKQKLEELRKMAKTMVSESKPKIKHAEDVIPYIEHYGLEDQEVLGIIVLNTSNKVLGIEEVHRGGINKVDVDLKVLFKRILQYQTSTNFILFHNHPSGTCQPSPEDKAITKVIKAASIILQFEMLDHIIICADGSFYGFERAGEMPNLITANAALSTLFQEA